MFRQLIGSEAGSPDSFSVPFPGGVVSLNIPKQLFILSPSHIAVPKGAPAMGLTTAISQKLPFIAPAPVVFVNPSVTRASIATVVNSQGLIVEVPPNTPRFDHDPVTLAPKGLLIEESRTNRIISSKDLVNTVLWTRAGVIIAESTDFPLFSTGLSVYLMTASGGSQRIRNIFQPFTTSTTQKTLSVFLRRGTNNFAQLVGGFDSQLFSNFDLSTGTVGTRGLSVTTTSMQPWKDGWYRCSLTTSSTTVSNFNVTIVTSIDAIRNETNTLATSIYIAGPQLEEGPNATSYIPTTTAAVTRAAEVLEEVETPFPSMSDALGSGITTSHIGLPLSGAETAAMSRLNIEAPASLRDWGAELIFTS